MNLADNLIRTRQAFPHRPVVRLDETVLSYEDLDGGSARVAGLLRGRVPTQPAVVPGRARHGRHEACLLKAVFRPDRPSDLIVSSTSEPFAGAQAQGGP